VLLPTAAEGGLLSQHAQSVKEYLMDLSFLRNAFGSNSNSSQARASWQDVPVSAAHQRKQEFRLIDVREPGEFRGDLGHIQGAELVPLATLATAAKSWNTETPILVICRSGGRSARGSELLASMGFSKVHNMAGGMLSWNAAGLPVVR
jgi:rhodanese-related sulfurtransferase